MNWRLQNNYFGFLKKLPNLGFHITRFPNLPVFQNITFQLLKASSSSAANYHAACREKSKADFINKLKIVEEELDESIFWMKYLVSIDKEWYNEATPLLKEGNELLSIIVASINTAKGNQKALQFQKSSIKTKS